MRPNRKVQTAVALSLGLLASGCDLEKKRPDVTYGILPGPLAPKHAGYFTEAFKPTGSMHCESCHLTQQRIDCLRACHRGEDEIKPQIDNKTGFHGQSCVLREYSLGGCQRCHKEHRGANMTMTPKSCQQQKNCACK